MANPVEQVCRGKLPACQPLGILAACAGKEPGPRCEEKQKQGEEKGKEGKSPKTNVDNMTRHRGEPTCEGNREFLFILPVVILQGGFELLPSSTVNYFNLYFSPQSP